MCAYIQRVGRMSRDIGRKFTPGPAIESVDMLLAARDAGRWIFFGSNSVPNWGKPRVYHPQWICNMNFNCVCSYIKHGVLRLASRNAQYPYVFKAEFMQAHVPEVSSEWWVTCSEIPAVRIVEITKEAVIASVADAMLKHGVSDSRFTVQFGAPETYVAPAPLLLK